MILSIGIPYVGISLACMKLFLGPQEENKGPLLKEHFLPLLSHLCASKLTSMLQEISSVALATKCLFFPLIIITIIKSVFLVSENDYY